MVWPVRSCHGSMAFLTKVRNTAHGLPGIGRAITTFLESKGRVMRHHFLLRLPGFAVLPPPTSAANGRPTTMALTS